LLDVNCRPTGREEKEDKNMQPMESIQRVWAERGLFALRDLLPLMRPVGVYEGWTNDQRQTLGMLLTAIARSSESVMLLCAYGQLWDAEMVLRSVCEGTLKFVFLLESREEFATRYDEYAESLFELSLLKDHQKAKDFLETASDPNADEWKPIRDRVLDEAECQRLRAKYHGAARRELEGRWGFTSLLNSLGRRRDATLRELTGLAWGYSLMSHLQHADFLGVALPFDREARADSRRDTMHLAHLARLVIDPLTHLLNRLTVGYRYVEADLQPVGRALAAIDAVRESFGGAYETWIETEYGARANGPEPSRSESDHEPPAGDR
jgi:hypothetical protein